MRNDCSINYHLSKLYIAEFSILYDNYISGERLKEKIEVDHSIIAVQYLSTKSVMVDLLL